MPEQTWVDRLTSSIAYADSAIKGTREAIERTDLMAVMEQLVKVGKALSDAHTNLEAAARLVVKEIDRRMGL